MKCLERIQDNIDEEIQKHDILSHYKLMLFFLFRRFEESGEDRYVGEKYAKMRHYFAEGIIDLMKKYYSLNLKDKTMIDVGGSTGDFCAYMAKRVGLKCVNIDPDENVINRANFQPSMIGSGTDIKFPDNKFDFVISRGVIEHVPIEYHKKFLQECFRVMKPNGFGYLTSSPWYAPWAGHQLAPFHIFPIKTACFLTNLFFGKKYNYSSYADADLYYLSYRGFKKMCTDVGFEIIYREDPITRLNFLTCIPLLREVLVQHMAFVVRKSVG